MVVVEVLGVVFSAEVWWWWWWLVVETARVVMLAVSLVIEILGVVFSVSSCCSVPGNHERCVIHHGPVSCLTRNRNQVPSVSLDWSGFQCRLGLHAVPTCTRGGIYILEVSVGIWCLSEDACV